MWPTWLTDVVVKQWGFAVPLMYAAATYGVFRWLDKEASGAAKVALTRKLQSKPPPKEVIGNFTIEVFDRVYTAPLFSWRALLRSVSITAGVIVAVWYENGTLGMMQDLRIRSDGSLIFYLSIFWPVVFNILSDFVSLFFIRSWLLRAREHPVLGLFGAAAVGIIIVYGATILRNWVAFLTSQQDQNLADYLHENIFNPFFSYDVTSPAFIVHLWLPLFALSIGLAQASGWLFKAVGWMQWFLKQGQYHPFQAVGYVASVIVFVSGVIIQYAWR
jgi:hypothetical protein